MYRNAGRHPVSFQLPPHHVTLTLTSTPASLSSVPFQGRCRPPKVSQNVKSTKTKTQQVAETESSSEESDASSQLTDLQESDEEDVSDQHDEDFAPNMSDDALGELLAQEVRSDKRTALSFIYIHHYDPQTPTIIHRSSRKAASQHSSGSGDEAEELETEGTQSSPRPPPTSSDTEESAAADAANDVAIVDVESGDSDADDFPETISRAQVCLSSLSTAFIDCSSCTQPASKKNNRHASRTASQAPVHEQQMQAQGMLCYISYLVTDYQCNQVSRDKKEATRSDAAPTHDKNIKRSHSQKDTTLSQITNSRHTLKETKVYFELLIVHLTNCF